MAEELMVVLNVLIIFSAMAFVIKTISDNALRRKALEKADLNEHIKYLFDRPGGLERSPMSAVKWGLVLIGLGAAIFVGRLFPYDIYESVTIGLMMLFAGLGFVIYYFLASKALKDKEK